MAAWLLVEPTLPRVYPRRNALAAPPSRSQRRTVKASAYLPSPPPKETRLPELERRFGPCVRSAPGSPKTNLNPRPHPRLPYRREQRGEQRNLPQHPPESTFHQPDRVLVPFLELSVHPTAHRHRESQVAHVERRLLPRDRDDQVHDLPERLDEEMHLLTPADLVDELLHSSGGTALRAQCSSCPQPVTKCPRLHVHRESPGQ